MCYPDRDYYITLFFQLLEEFEAATPLNRTERRGAPNNVGQFHLAFTIQKCFTDDGFISLKGLMEN